MQSRRVQLATAAAIAAFMAFHLTAITVRALPTPDAAMDRSQWGDPTVAKELDAWAARFGRFGVHLTREQLGDKLYRVASRYISIRNHLFVPFGPYYDWCGTFQSWQMFVAPHQHPARLRVEILEGDAWRTVFREDDPDARWMSRELGDTRWRSLIFRFSWPSFHGQLERMTDWLSRRAASDFPSAKKLRVIFARADAPEPEQVRAGNLPKEVDDAPIERDLTAIRASGLAL